MTLTDIFLQSKKLACFVSVKPRASFHMISVDGEGIVKSIEHIAKSGARINGGFFLFRREVFRYIKEGEELVEQPFRRLISEGQLLSYLTTVSGPVWIRSKSYRNLRIYTAGVRHRGLCGMAIH